MGIHYVSKGVNNYIETNIEKKINEEAEKSFVFKMLDNNEIDGLIKPAVSMLDSNIYLRYPINSLFVLEKFFIKQKPDIKILESVLSDICNCIRNLEGYLMNPNDLVLSPRYMLWDDKNKSVKFILSPFYNVDIKQQLKNLMEYMMRNFDYKSPEGTVGMYGIYEIIIKETFDLSELEAFISSRTVTKEPDIIEENNNTVTVYRNSFKVPDEKNEDEEAVIIETSDKQELFIKINAIVSAAFFTGYAFTNRSGIMFVLFIISIIALVINAMVYIIKKEKEDEIDADESMEEFRQRTLDFEENSIIKEDFTERPKFEKKAASSNKKEYKLIPLNDGMLNPVIINMNTERLVIGRDKKETDYRLNKEQISRIHASITVRNNNIFIEDKNSTNGTYVNSVKLNAFEQFKLNEGDIIKFANEEFFVA